ncbi:MAG: DUF4397 domain-containing protein [Woeseiaceae bacterium]
MKRILTLLAGAGALFLAACSGETNLPDPTGEGGVRAINAIPGSPSVTFLIEERSLGSVGYKDSSTPALYDNFEYNFNFDISLPAQAERERIASVPLQVEADREHVFVLTGDLAAPTVTIWTADLREWNETDTAFEARFAHLAESLGSVDVYLYDNDGPAPVQGEQVGSLDYGEVMDPVDFEDGVYRALITAAGDIDTVYHSSIAVILNAQSSYLISLFDGNENETSPYMLQSMSTAGQSQSMPDPAYPPTIRFVHGARTLQNVDIYADESLTDRVVADLGLGEATPDIVTGTDDATWYMTPAGSTATVLFEQPVPGARWSTPTMLYLTGDTDDWSGVNLFQDRASTSTVAKVSLFHSAVNVDAIDLYFLERGETLTDESRPNISRANYGVPSATAALAAGSYDLYVREYATTTQIGGPYELDIELGDVVNLLGIDAVNPGEIDIVDVSLP